METYISQLSFRLGEALRQGAFLDAEFSQFFICFTFLHLKLSQHRLKLLKFPPCGRHSGLPTFDLRFNTVNFFLSYTFLTGRHHTIHTGIQKQNMEYYKNASQY